jgi:hypothetical protein
MASKRPKISFPELEPKGRHAILRTADEIAAEATMLANQQSSTSVQRHSGDPESQQAIDSPTTKVSYRIRPEAVDAVEDMRRVLSRQYRIKASREKIAEAAILAAYEDLLDNQHASKLVNQLIGIEE